MFTTDRFFLSGFVIFYFDLKKMESSKKGSHQALALATLKATGESSIELSLAVEEQCQISTIFSDVAHIDSCVYC